jgi:membrane protein implicated in regulation of membrane protease activity
MSAVLLQLVPQWALDYGAAGILAFVLGYVVYDFVIKRLRRRIQQLEEENEELENENGRLREQLVESRKEKYSKDISHLKSRIEELKEDGQ